MTTIERKYIVADPLAYLSRLGELGFSLASERRREVERGDGGEVKSECFRTVFRAEETSVVLEEYPFVRFARIRGEEHGVKEIAVRLGFSEADAVGESVAALFERWREERGLSRRSGLRFTDYDQ